MNSDQIQQIVAEVIRRLQTGESGDSLPESADPVRLVTEDRVRETIAAGGDSIPVLDSTVVTPLARDLLKGSGIRLTVVGTEPGPSAPEAERVVRIAMAADVNQRERGRRLARWLEQKGHTVEVVGWASPERPAWLPLVIAAARRVSEGACDVAVTIDLDGARAAIAANKLRGVRSATCGDVGTARRARLELDANVINLSTETVSETLTQQILSVWLRTGYDGRFGAGRDMVEGLE